MEFELGISIYVFIIGFYAILLSFLTYKLIKHNFSVFCLLMIPFFGILGGIFAILDMSDVPTILLYFNNIYLTLELLCWGLQFFFFYLFLEYISAVRPKIWRMLIAFGLLTLQFLSHILIILFDPISEIFSNNLWLLADIGYNNLAFFGLFFGVYTYYRIFQYTNEIRTLGFILGLILAILGFMVHSLVDYLEFFSKLPSLLGDLSFLGDALPMLGLFTFLATYLFDLDYVYRLPGDHLFLLVTYKNGLAIHLIEFECNSKVKVEENFFSGFISSLNFIFENVLKSKYPLESISSREETIIIRAGKKILVVFLTRKPTSILIKAMDNYIKEFEEKFFSELEREELEISKFRKANELINPVFPFLKIKESKNSFL